MRPFTIAICGCGNGAHACAALMKQQGHTVHIYSPLSEEISRFRAACKASGGLTMRFGPGLMSAAYTEGASYGPEVETVEHLVPDRITDNPAEAIPNAAVVFVVAPSFAHRNILKHIAPHLSTNSVMVFIPSRGGLEYEVRSLVPNASIVAFQTLPWATRVKTFGSEILISGRKKSILAASIPGDVSEVVFGQLEQLLEMQIIRLDHALTLTLANAGQVIHPGIMYSNFKDDPQRVYTADEIPLFYQGLSDEGGRRLDAMSREIIEIAYAAAAKVPGVQPEMVLTIGDWLLMSYDDSITDTSSVAAMMRSNKPYMGLKAPVRKVGENRYMADFSTRYIVEDIPYGLLVSKSLAGMLGVDTPTIDEVMAGIDSWTGNDYLGRLSSLKTLAGHARLPELYGAFTVDDVY